MKHIYSKIDPSILLHMVLRLDEAKIQPEQRIDIIKPDNFLQCSCLKMKTGTTFKPHKHIEKEKHYTNQIAQESWVVLQGSVKCIFYDIDDTIIEEIILKTGDCSFTLKGGHNYYILEDDTIVYEYKTGPYEGQKLDKVFIQQNNLDFVI